MRTDFEQQLRGRRLTTAEIVYYMPDHPGLLQEFLRNAIKGLDQINEELRSQYLLTYYSSNTGPKDQWRKIEVKVEPTSLQARSISGYYP